MNGQILCANAACSNTFEKTSPEHLFCSTSCYEVSRAIRAPRAPSLAHGQQDPLHNQLLRVGLSGGSRLTRAEAESLVVHLLRTAFEVSRAHKIPAIAVSLTPTVQGGGACFMTSKAGSDYQLMLKLIAVQAQQAERFGSFDEPLQGVPG